MYNLLRFIYNCLDKKTCCSGGGGDGAEVVSKDASVKEIDTTAKDTSLDKTVKKYVNKAKLSSKIRKAVLSHKL